jgi:hypothetical protein
LEVVEMMVFWIMTFLLFFSRARPHYCPGMHRSLRLIVQVTFLNLGKQLPLQIAIYPDDKRKYIPLKN